MIFHDHDTISCHHEIYNVIKDQMIKRACRCIPSWDDMHMVSIRVRYGFRWHSDKPYRTNRRRVRYGLSEFHLNPYRKRMDVMCIFSHEIPLNWSSIRKQKLIWNITNTCWEPQSAIWRQIRTVLKIETRPRSARNIRLQNPIILSASECWEIR